MRAIVACKATGATPNVAHHPSFCGTSGDAFYLLVDGTVELLKENESQRVLEQVVRVVA